VLTARKILKQKNTKMVFGKKLAMNVWRRGCDASSDDA